MKTFRPLGKMAKELFQTSHFKEDLKKIIRSRRHRLEDLRDVLNQLQEGVPLDPRHENHPLFGKWQGYKECHIKPDWLLIYEETRESLHLIRTGSHSDLFV